MNIFDLSGKRAIVTGATGLLGKVHCKALLEAGARVAVADINDEAVHSVCEEMGGNTIPLTLDVTEKDSLETGCLEVLRAWDGVDILVNNAAINDKVENGLNEKAIPFEALSLRDWQASLDVNLTGVFLCCQVFGREMARQHHGSIINIASTYGITAPDQRLYQDKNGEQLKFKTAAYCVTKGALFSFTKYLAAYWANMNVRVNTLVPGGVENGQDPYFISQYSARTPMGRMAKPKDLQGALVFLSSDASSYVTGTEVVVDGGWTAW